MSLGELAWKELGTGRLAAAGLGPASSGRPCSFSARPGPEGAAARREGSRRRGGGRGGLAGQVEEVAQGALADVLVLRELEAARQRDRREGRPPSPARRATNFGYDQFTSSCATAEAPAWRMP